MVRPSFGLLDLLSALAPNARSGAEERLKAALREFTGLRHVSLFPYARMGLYCLLRSSGIAAGEVLVSSYTCVVVPQEVLASGHTPRFFEPAEGLIASPEQHGLTDIEIVTHIYGSQVDIGGIQSRPRLLIEDSCLSWAPSAGGPRGDVVMFSLNLSKQVTTLWGGVLATDDDALHDQVERTWAQESHRPVAHELKTFFQLLAAILLYSKPGYTLAHLVKRITGLSNTPNYSLEAPHRPANAFAPMTRLQCVLAELQLARLPEAMRRRRELARLYRTELQDLVDLELPDEAELTNPSHFIVRCEQAQAIRRELYALGVNTGNPIDYTCAKLQMFAGAPGTDEDYSISARRALTTIALPFHLHLTNRDVLRICVAMRTAWRRVGQP